MLARVSVIVLLFHCALAFYFDLFGVNNLYELGETSAPEPGQEWNGTIWAVLVAGSNGWFNYRHQADICHAYQVLRRHGIPERNVVVMMYDDIANNEQNPTPGIIINKPGGNDVYKGVPKDYVGKDVTPEMLLRVLQGDRTLDRRGRKVVKSGPDDHIFLYFADHGAPGLVAFPSSELSAKDLNRALKRMSLNKKFKKMVIYIEACESGSMFNGLLPKNLNIFATTAANSTESSYACYYDDVRETFLGDVYSVNWLEDSDQALLKRETLQHQFQKVRKETNTSHVKEFGDLTIGRLHVSQFQGSKPLPVRLQSITNVRSFDDAVPSGDVPLVIAQKKLAKANSEEERYLNQVKYEEILRSRSFLANSLRQFLREIEYDISFDAVWKSKKTLRNHDCYMWMTNQFDKHCFDLSTHPFALRFLYVFVNLCESVDANSKPTISKWVDQLVKHCQSNVKGHPFKQIL